MSAARHLPSGAEQTAYAQGWDDESLVVHLAGFLSGKGLDQELSDYLAAAADEENADLDEETGEDEAGDDEADEDAVRQ